MYNRKKVGITTLENFSFGCIVNVYVDKKLVRDVV